jgi:hypothetical protein
LRRSMDDSTAAPPAPATEIVDMLDGEAAQVLVPGVEPVSKWTRRLDAERRRREARRGCAPCPQGGLFDPDGRQQQGELF